MQTGAGATAYASASQKWNGTTAALTKNPVSSSAKATTTRPSTGSRSSARPISARLREPLRPYSSAMPDSTMNPPTLLVTAKLSAPCSERGSSER